MQCANKVIDIVDSICQKMSESALTYFDESGMRVYGKQSGYIVPQMPDIHI